MSATLHNFSERTFLGELFNIFKKPSRITTREWAETYRVLSTSETADPGPMDCSKTPWMLYVMECLDNPNINTIIARKSARISWTTTINSWIGRTMHLDPRNIGIAFPRAAGARNFYNEFLKPLIVNTPVIYEMVTKHNKLSRISHKFIPYDGGFLKLINLGSADEAKSSMIPYIIVEEPDGIKKDVNKQGDGMALITERKKSVNKDWKIIYGGTPTDKEFSQVDRAYDASNQMKYMVPCHLCGKFHELTFHNLHYNTWPDLSIHDIYGNYNPETAYYRCPHCQGMWSFEEKNLNVIEATNYNNKGWVITKPEVKDIYGFAFNELLSSFANSSFVELGKQYLKARKAYDEGHEGLMKSFINNQMGEAYVPLTNFFTVEQLRKRRSVYPEMIVPIEGLILTCGIDKQRGGSSAKSRFAICVRAWGRNGNSWLVHWIEIEGNTQDYSDPIWQQLTDYLNQDFPHASGEGRTMKISAVAIDCGDDTELVYRYVDDMTTPYDKDGNPKEPTFYRHPWGSTCFAVKGSTSKYDIYDIYNDPKTMEVANGTQYRATLAERMGVNLYLMGTYRSHDELERRINLNGNRDRWYFCETAYPKYEEGLLSCRKTFEGYDDKGYWRQLPGRAKEVRDCERLNLWCSHALGINRFSNQNWNSLEHQLFKSKR